MKALTLSAALLCGSLALAQTAPTSTTGTSSTGTSTSATSTSAPASTAAAPVQNPSTVVAVIGTTRLTLGEFEAQYGQFVARALASQGVPVSPDILAGFAPYRGQILQQIARQQAIMVLAGRAKITVDPATVSAHIDQSKQGFDDEDDFIAALKGAGFADEAAYQSAVTQDLMYSAYLDSLKSRFTFSDLVVNSYYLGNKDKLATQAQACVKHILVADQATADKVSGLLKAGGDFAALAKQYSTDPGSKDQGGDLGCIAPGDTVPEFDKAAFSGPLNTVQTVKSQYGYHLLIVTKRTAAGVPALADVAASIRDTLAAQAAQKYLDAQIQKLGVKTYPQLVTPAGAPTAPAGK